MQSSGAGAEPSPQARVLWTDATAQLPGWVTRYGNAGGSLRSLTTPRTLAKQQQACWVAVQEVPSYQPTDPGTQRVIGMLRKLLERGDAPPVHPAVERRLLEELGLETTTLPDDLAPVVSGTTMDTWREDGVLSRVDAELNQDLRFDSDEERQFLTLVAERLGPDAARWVLPQASLDQLLRGHGHPELAVGHRRVDFLIAAPWLPPFVVEIDGRHHAEAIEVDRERDKALRQIGMPVIRIPAEEVRRGMGRQLDALARLWTPPREIAETERAKALLVPVQLHRTVLGITHALEAGFLAGQRWAIELHDDLDVVAPFLGEYLSLIAAVDSLWGGVLTPDEVQITTSTTAWSYLRNGLAYEAVPLIDAAPVDVRLHVEFHRTAVEALPAVDTRVPTVVVRTAVLPVHLADQPHGPSERVVALTEGSDTDAALTVLLQALFAKRAFRDGQLQAIREVLSGRDCVVLLPTGAGKSLIYQLAGLCLPGRTLVVDPIVALMEDQVRGLQHHGIDRAVAISSQGIREYGAAALLGQVANADAHFALVAPERLQQQAFRNALRELAAATPINLVVVDEAHCVSEWGHDFRTSYLRIGKVLRETCRDTANQEPPVLALTGTASRAVLRDVLAELDINPAGSPHTMVRPDTFDRPELGFEVVRSDPASHLARLKGVVRNLPSRFGRPAGHFFASRGPATYSGLVFCPHVNGPFGVTDVADELRSVIAGGEIGIFSGKQPRNVPGNWGPLRQRNAQQFKDNDLPVLVATKSFGMGIDKPNIRWVVHYGIPGSIESY